MSMTPYETRYRCMACPPKICIVIVNDNGEGQPPICVYGKNVTAVIAGELPRWEIISQRFKPEAALQEAGK